MAPVDVRQVEKFFGSVQVLHGVSVDIPDGEFVVLVGPSGCGKSTLLRMIAGLEEISRGEIAIGGRVVNNVPPKDRDIAMVFQNYALYPHMTVKENMAFSLKLARAPKAVIEERVGKAAQILGLGQLLDRYPRQLSGGQRQRVAMGRAIVRDPQVFLFDEPLSNLDAKLRVQMRTEIKELHQRLKTTSVYVTHDQIEAMTMADRIVVLQLGHVEQVGAPLDLYDRPANLFVAGFIGSPAMNFIDATLRRADGSAVAVAADGDAAAGCRADGRPAGTASRSSTASGPSTSSCVPAGQGLDAEVVVVEPTGAETLVVNRIAGTEVQAVFRERHRLNPGDRIGLGAAARHGARVRQGERAAAGGLGCPGRLRPPSASAARGRRASTLAPSASWPGSTGPPTGHERVSVRPAWPPGRAGGRQGREQHRPEAAADGGGAARPARDAGQERGRDGRPRGDGAGGLLAGQKVAGVAAVGREAPRARVGAAARGRARSGRRGGPWRRGGAGALGLADDRLGDAAHRVAAGVALGEEPKSTRTSPAAIASSSTSKASGSSRARRSSRPRGARSR